MTNNYNHVYDRVIMLHGNYISVVELSIRHGRRAKLPIHCRLAASPWSHTSLAHLIHRLLIVIVIGFCLSHATSPTLVTSSIKHIPKSARSTFAQHLGSLLRSTVSDPNSVTKWTALFNWCGVILAPQGRVGNVIICPLLSRAASLIILLLGPAGCLQRFSRSQLDFSGRFAAGDETRRKGREEKGREGRDGRRNGSVGRKGGRVCLTSRLTTIRYGCCTLGPFYIQERSQKRLSPAFLIKQKSSGGFF